jgi:hypothetical protein
MSEKGSEADIEPCRVNVAEVPRAEILRTRASALELRTKPIKIPPARRRRDFAGETLQWIEVKSTFVSAAQLPGFS